MRFRRQLCFLLSLQLCAFCWLQTYYALADSNTDSGVNSKVDLDLSSANRNISAQNSSPVVITVGGNQVTVTHSDMLTPAEYLAAMQVMNGGQQSLILNAAGIAAGGNFQLTSSLNSTIQNLVIPTGVTAVQDFGSSQALNLTGNFINSGNYLALSTNNYVTSGSLTALNITNNAGGLLTSVMSSDLLSGLSGFSNLVSSFSLNLIALNDITNYGNISSSGALNMIAGNSIINGNVANNIAASISAMGNINMIASNVVNQSQITSALNNINIQAMNMTNSGVLQSMQGNITVSSLVQKVLTIDNGSGLIAADKTLNFTNLNFSSDSLIQVIGGQLSASKINFTVRTGTANIQVEDISPNLNIAANKVIINVSNGSSGLDLKGVDRASSVGFVYNGVGDVQSVGFKTLGNLVDITTRNGSINIGGNITTVAGFGNDAGDVKLSAGNLINVAGSISSTAAGAGNGGDVKLTAVNSVRVASVNTSTTGIGDAGTIRLVAGSSITSGSLSATTSGAGDAGNIKMSAGTSISTGGLSSAATGSGNAGNVQLESVDTLRVTGSINTNSVSGDAGNIRLKSGDALTITSGINTSSVSGAAGNVNLKSADTISVTNSINTSSVSGSAGNVKIRAGENINISSVNTNVTGLLNNSNAGNIKMSAGGAINLNGNLSATNSGSGDAGNIKLVSAGVLNTKAISTNALGSGDAGNIQLRSKHDSIITNGALNASGSSKGGNAGNIKLDAADSLNISNSVTATAAAGGNSGNINLSAGESVRTTGILNTSVSGSGNAGNIKISAGKDINSISIYTNATGSGNAGNLRMSAGENLTINGNINSYNSSSGNGGNIKLVADKAISISGSIYTNTSGAGKAGNVRINAGEALSLSGNINSYSSGAGNGGNVKLSADKAINIAGSVNTNTSGAGNAGNLQIKAGEGLNFSGNINSNSSGSGNSGDVNLAAGNSLSLSGSVNVNTSGAGAGGDIKLAAGDSLTVSGNLNANTLGASNAGSIQITAGDAATVNGNLYTNTSGAGNAGTVTIEAGGVRVTGNINSNATGAGDGGNVSVSSGTTIQIVNVVTTSKSGDGGNIILEAGSQINAGVLNSSVTTGTGAAGEIIVTAGTTGSGNVVLVTGTANSPSGNGSITINTPGAINVSDSLNAVNGNVVLNSSSNNIHKVDVGNGQVEIAPSTAGGIYNLDLSQLASLGSANVSIGGVNGLSSDIVITGNCNQCFGNLSSVSINTTGSYSATGTVLTLSANTSLQITAGEGINTGSVSGGSSISYQSAGVIKVDGDINMPSGQVTLSGSNFEITGQINATGGTVTMLPGDGSVLNASQLNNISTGTLQIGSGTENTHITLTGTANLSNISNQVVFSTQGDFTGTTSSLNLSSTASLSITANNVDTGNISGGRSVTVEATGVLTMAGDINVPSGNVTLSSENNAGGTIMNLASGHQIIAQSINISSIGGDIVTGAKMQAGSISIDSGAALHILGASDFSASTNLTLNSQGDMQIGASGGPVQFASSATTNTLNPYNVILSTQGAYIATGATVSLSANTALSISAEDGIFTGSISGGKALSFETAGTVKVDGNVNPLATATVQLSGSAFDITGSITALSGTVALLPSANTSFNAAQFGNISSSTLKIGNGTGSANFTLTGQGSLANISSQIIVSLGGDFLAAGSSLSLASGASLNVSADNISTGRLSGGSSILVNAAESLLVKGDINTPTGTLSLNSDGNGTGSAMSIDSGLSLTAKSVSIHSVAGNITSGAQIASVNGSIAVDSGAALNILQASSLVASKDLVLSSKGDMQIGQAGGSLVSLSAGNLGATNPWLLAGTVRAGTSASSGNVILDSYHGGNGTGNIELGSNVNILAVGDGPSGSTNGYNPSSGGDLGILSAKDINVGGGSQLLSIGGNLWLSAGQNIDLENGVNIGSIAMIGGGGQVGPDGLYLSLPAYSGGMIGIMAGAPDTDMSALLGGLAGARGINDVVAMSGNVGWSASNRIYSSGGSRMEIVFPAGGAKSVTNSTFVLSGGVIYLDPPDSTSTVNISGANFTVLGPQFSPPPPASSPPSSEFITGKATPGIVGFSIPGLAGSGILSTVGGSITSSDTLFNAPMRTQTNQSIPINGVFSTSGQTTVPSDTLGARSKKQPVKPAIFCTAPQLIKPNENVNEDSWIIATNSCQPFTFEEHDGSLIVGTGPAKFAPTVDRTLLLKEGKILVITTEKIHVVRTPDCNITVPVNTATIVECSSVGISRIANLSGGKNSITVCRDDETLIVAVVPGEQLILAGATVSDDDFCAFAFPDVTHRKIESWQVELPGLKGQKMRFDRQAMAEHEPLLHCSMGCVNQVQLRRIQQVMQSMNSPDGILKSMDTPKRNSKKAAPPVFIGKTEKTVLSPVAYHEGSFLRADLQVPLSQMNSLNADTATIKYLNKAKVMMPQPGQIDLHEGELLVSTHKKTILTAGAARVEIDAGTIAMVSYRDNMLKLRNIVGKGSTAVRAYLGTKNCMGIQVGQELIIGPRGMSLARAFGEEPVGRRRLTSLDTVSGHNCISSEISLTSLLQNSSMLYQLMHSNDERDKQMCKKIMKMAVCLTIVTASHGNYSLNEYQK